ncbi:hypothetical protein XFF6992_490042 [Xanthomonas citri pv. fuscans]|nr:hypothetical protein [Xanthomonas citri]SOO20739.1 hypothetical protein XFF6992_490042 [Xanthomonas citri pv. fuscans]SOO35084.1 hypothetical protein XFF6994_5000002 [Xanthomonas citri pv. fuscans]
MLAGANVDIALAGGLKNIGTIAARQLVSIDAGRIDHLGGSISGDQVGLRSASDIRIAGARVTAVDALSVKAVGDVSKRPVTTHSHTASSRLGYRIPSNGSPACLQNVINLRDGGN